jgi:DNA-binding MarR family transcriptional regulator
VTPSDQDITQIIEHFRAANAALHRVSLPTWLELGLTMAQFKALVAVEGCGATSVGGVASDLGIGESAASSLVEQLVRAGYARRTEDPADRRRAVVTVTERGASLLGELRHGKRVALREWLEKLSEDDRAMLGRALSALAAVLPQTEAQAGSGADDARVQP